MKIFLSEKRGVDCRRSGFTLIEAMILMVILGVVSLGVGVSLRSLISVPESNNRVLAVSSLLVDKMEYLRSLGYSTLSTTANGTDSPIIDNVTYSRSWTITANPGGTYDANFLQISVTIGNRTLTTGVTKQ